MRRFLSLSILLLFIVHGLVAQEVVFTTRVQENKMGTKDVIRVQYEIENVQRVQNLQLTNQKDFMMIGEPSEGSRLDMTNDKVSMSKTYTFLFQPKRAGRLTFPIALARVKGKTIKSKPVSIDVVKGSMAKRQAPRRRQMVDPFADMMEEFEQMEQQMMAQRRQLFNQRRQQGRNQQQYQRNARPAVRDLVTPENLRENLFIKAEVDKQQVRVGEQIMVSYKLYSRVEAQMSSIKSPKLSNFWTQDFDMPRYPQPKREMYKGKEYSVITIKKSALFPTQLGELTIDPLEVEGVVTLQNPVPVRRTNPYGNVFQEEIIYEPYQKPIKDSSEPITITVVEFPEEEKPADFNGAVGSFEIESKISAAEVSTDDVATLTVIIRGSGNLKLMEAPKLLLPDSIVEVFDPIVFDTITSKAKNRITGYKKIQYRFMPKGTGELKIPSVRLAYYNANAERYETKETTEYSIRVKPGKVERKGEHILPMYIHDIASENMKLQKDKSIILPEQMWYWGAYLLPALGFIFLLGFSRKEEHERKDKVRFKNKRANKVALKRLDKAEQHRKANEQTKFYEETSKAVWLYLSDKLNIPLATLSKEMAGTLLRRKEISQNLIDEVFLITDECELALYAPEAGDFKMNQIYSDSLRLIGTLEDKLG